VPKIAIYDYGVGNLRSVSKAIEHGGAEVVVTKDEELLFGSDGIVLPGVGAFEDAIKEIMAHGKGLERYAKKRPVLGICLGLQLCFTESEEGGLHRGLDLFRGRVVRLPKGVKIPQMGWNSLEIKRRTPLLEGVRDGSYFYFVHSYYAVEEEDIVSASTDYGVKLPAVCEKGNIYATQFHPEKSGTAGLRMIENFIELACG